MEYGEINIDSSLFVNYKVWSLSDEVVSIGRVMLPFCSVSLQQTQLYRLYAIGLFNINIIELNFYISEVNTEQPKPDIKKEYIPKLLDSVIRRSSQSPLLLYGCRG